MTAPRKRTISDMCWRIHGLALALAVIGESLKETCESDTWVAITETANAIAEEAGDAIDQLGPQEAAGGQRSS